MENSLKPTAIFTLCLLMVSVFASLPVTSETYGEVNLLQKGLRNKEKPSVSQAQVYQPLQNEAHREYADLSGWNVSYSLVDFERFQARVSMGLEIVLPVGAEESLTLSLISEPLEWGAAIMDEQGIKQEVIDLYELRTSNDFNKGNARFLLSPQSFSGTLITNEKIVDYTVHDWTDDGNLVMMIASRSNPLNASSSASGENSLEHCGSIADPSLDELYQEVCHTITDLGDDLIFRTPPSYPYNPPQPPRERHVSGFFHLEESFRDEISDPFIHAATAWGHARDMWTDYTGNRYGGQGFFNGPNINAGVSCSTHLLNFGSQIIDINREVSDYFVLITGQLTNALGCAWGDRGILFDPPDSVNYGLSNSGSNYFGRVSTHHLGKLIAQEVGHNWGEDEHPCTDENGEYSIMCDNFAWDSKAFWLHYGEPLWDCDMSMERIISGTSEYDPDIDEGDCDSGPPVIIQV